MDQLLKAMVKKLNSKSMEAIIIVIITVIKIEVVLQKIPENTMDSQEHKQMDYRTNQSRVFSEIPND